MARLLFSSLEPLESRIAPASLAIYHPLIDLTPAHGQTGATIDLANSFDQDPLGGFRTHVVFTTNYDIDPHTPGLQPGKIVLELFNDKAPLSVQDFLSYLGQGGYAGTYFHRVVNQIASPTQQNLQILQGGQFEASAPTTAIKAGLPVHNEFDASDAERSNTDGTIAFAKLGGDPNSATDGFFFNLGDNSQNLDNQNGGFTVFGKIVSGLDVAKAIAALPTTEIIAGFPAPYQNGYQTDPDGNASTPAPVPTAKQLVDITGAQIIPAKNYTAPGVQFSHLQIIDEVSGLPTSAVTGSIAGGQLSLHYAPGASGIFQVNVKVTDSAKDTVTESFHVNLTPNLVGTAVSDGFQQVIQVGDTATESVKLTNTAAGTSHTHVTVSYFLTAGASSGLADVPVGSFTSAINLASGKSATVSGKIKVLDSARDSLAEGNYQLIGKISTDGSAINTDLYTDDNGVTAGVHHYAASNAPASDFAAGTIHDSLNPIIVPGDTGIAQVAIVNASGTAAHGSVDVKFYLSEQVAAGTAAPPDVLIGSLSSVSLSLAPGKTINVNVPVMVPDTVTMDQALYTVHAVVVSSATGGAGDIYAGNDDRNSTYNHGLLNEFGNLQIGTTKRTGAVLKYADGTGQLVSLKLVGPGTGSVQSDSTGGVSWYVDGNTTATAFSMGLTAANGAPLTNGAHTVVNDIIVGAQGSRAIGSVSLGMADWTDTVSMLGGAGRVTLGNTSGPGDHFLGLGTPGTGAALQPAIVLGTLQDTSLTSSAPIVSLTTGGWLSVNGDAQSIQAPGIGTFSVHGDFTADVTITPATTSAAPVLRALTVDGTLLGSNFQVNGNVGSVRVGALSGSNFLVGASFVPQALRDFTGADTVGSFVVTGGNGTSTYGVTASNIAAEHFTKLVLSSVNPDNSGQAFGVVAETIATYQRGVTTQTNLDYTHPGGTPDSAGNYSVTLLNPAG